MSISNIVVVKIIPEFHYYRPWHVQKLTPIERLSDHGVSLIENSINNVDSDVLYHFPIILVGSIYWKHGTHYLLERAMAAETVNYKTIIGIARDLKDFKSWVIDHDIDYLLCEHIIQSPVRRYRRHLDSSHYKPSVISRKMSRLVSFYRWLVRSENINFDKPLWVSTESNILVKSNAGQNIQIKVPSTDVQKGSGKNQNRGVGYDGYILDGGLLKPYSLTDQKILLGCLDKLGNTEMTLSFLIALATGARLQSVLTLRKCHFSEEVKIDSSEVIIYAGDWPVHRAPKNTMSKLNQASLINTKASKGIKIYFPKWLYDKVKVYLHSARDKKRASKCNHNPDNSENQYLFLTTRARPFYSSTFDPQNIAYQKPPDGAALQQFISQQLRPLLIRSGFKEHFKFHNLRASYGMNLVRSKMQFVGSEGGLSLTELFAIVQLRMGHSNFKTTQMYLSFDLKQEIAFEVQSSYESMLEAMYLDRKGGWGLA